MASEEAVNPQLLRLKYQSKQLERLQHQIHDLKTASLIPKLPEICALCVIVDGEVGLQFFVDTELESAFLLFEDYFTTKCLALYHEHFEDDDTIDTTSNSNCDSDDDPKDEVALHLVDDWYSILVRAPNSNRNESNQSNDRMLFFLTKSDGTGQWTECQSLDMLHSVVIESCCALQTVSVSTKSKSRNVVHSPTASRSISTATALIEIADEVFGGGDNEMPLNEMEFVTAMTVRLGLESLWGSQTTECLQSLFGAIWSDIEEEERWYLEETPCIVFAQFVDHFNVEQHSRHSLWHSICDCIAESPLSRRNTKRREREKWTVMAVKERLSLIEHLVNLAEDIVIDEMQIKHQRLWRRKWLKNRDVISQFRDEMMTQILAQNKTLKSTLSALTEKSGGHGVDAEDGVVDIESLKEIEAKYKVLVERQKRDQRAMKEMESTIRKKEDEIYKLKSQLIGFQTLTLRQTENGRHRLSAHNVVNHGLLRLKGEIAQTKLDVQRQLESMSCAQIQSVATVAV